MTTENLNMDYSKYDFKDSTDLYVHLSKKGLSKDTVIAISKMKDEPQWMLDFRLRSYEIFMKKPMPTWGGDLSVIDFQNIYYYAKATEKTEKNWDDVPADIKATFDKLGIPEAEKKFLAGVGAQYESEDVYHNLRVDLAKQRYTTIQNWSIDVYNLVTKRAYAYEGAKVEWIEGNIGSKLTMKYPGIYLMGERAYGETLSIAFAGKNQHQDTGAKMVHLAPNTTSKITSKSVSRLNGRSTYRGLLHVAKGATNVKATVRCDALLLDDTSKTDTYPYMEINQEDATITHEATVGKIGDEQIFYLMTRGFSEEEALTLIVNGFMEPFTKELPMEYAVELNRLIKLEMDGSVG